VRQLEEELRVLRSTSRSSNNVETSRQIEALVQENEHLVREIRILRETIKVMMNPMFSPVSKPNLTCK